MTQFVTQAEVQAAAAFVRSRTDIRPTVGIILGSGLNGVADAVEQAVSIPTADIPHWPASTVLGHAGRLVVGYLEGKPVAVLQGRIHFYEGYPMDRVVFPVKVMHALGIGTLLVTNAAGGLNTTFSAGDLMLIRDHLNFPGMAGHHPLRGPNDDSIGTRFPDLSAAYAPELRQLAHKVAREAGLHLREGVYAYVAGPSFETPAELRFLRMAGGDAVGMSTAPEVVTAHHAGVRVLGISTISNMAIVEPTAGVEATHEEVLATGASVVPRLGSLIKGIIRELA